MQECLNSHPIMHTLTGLGLGLVTANMVSSLSGSTGISFGLVLIAAGLLGEFMINHKTTTKTRSRR